MAVFISSKPMAAKSIKEAASLSCESNKDEYVIKEEEAQV